MDVDPFLILLILLSFDRMRQGPNNYKTFVKTQIFLQFTLANVKV